MNGLQANTSSVNASLQAIAVALEDAFANCTSLENTTMMSVGCEPLNPSIYSDGLGADYFSVSLTLLFKEESSNYCYFD